MKEAGRGSEAPRPCSSPELTISFFPGTVYAGENLCREDSGKQRLGVSCRATGSSTGHSAAPSSQRQQPWQGLSSRNPAGHRRVPTCQSSYLLSQLRKQCQGKLYVLCTIRASRDTPARFSDTSGRRMLVNPLSSARCGAAPAYVLLCRSHRPQGWEGCCVRNHPREPKPRSCGKGSAILQLLHGVSVPKPAVLGA